MTVAKFLGSLIPPLSALCPFTPAHTLARPVREMAFENLLLTADDTKSNWVTSLFTKM